jgi:hypothetical protein
MNKSKKRPNKRLILTSREAQLAYNGLWWWLSEDRTAPADTITALQAKLLKMGASP